MAEILIKAISAAHADPMKDQRGCYKRGMPVVVMPDGHPWGLEEGLPKFVLLKIPLIPVPVVEKYIAQAVDGNGDVIQRRTWQIRWDDLPAAARNKLQNTGQLVVKATASYTGSFDYTWAQIKDYFRNTQTLLTENAELS